jgi:hypothetical protein
MIDMIMGLSKSQLVGSVVLGLAITYIVLSLFKSVDLNMDNILNMNNIFIAIISISCYPAFILGKMVVGKDMSMPDKDKKY